MNYNLIYSCLDGSVNCRFIDWPVKNPLMRTKVAIDDVPESYFYTNCVRVLSPKPQIEAAPTCV